MSALEDREALTEITQPFSMLTQIRPVAFLYFLVISCLCFLVQLIMERSLVISIVDYLFAFCFSVLSYLCVLIAT